MDGSVEGSQVNTKPDNLVYEKEKELLEINEMRIKTLEKILQEKMIIIEN